MGYELYVHSIENGQVICGINADEKRPVSNNVKPQYIKTGMAEVSETNGVITYIKMKNSADNSSQSPKPASEYKGKSFGQEENEKKQLMIVRQSSLKCSVEIMNIMRENNGNTDEKLEVNDLTNAVIANADVLTKWVMS